ncbi:hypothetical protein D1007_44445 [Hordeum vulgare]|nr:hypothetical protein D1007_44445 [Hordeum vulgare]
MAKNSTKIKTLLESMLKRIKMGQLTANKHVEAQLAFNEQVSSDLAHLHKQMDLRHTDVDEVRRHHDQSRSIAPPLLHHQPQIPPTEQPFPCLANAGSPLIRTRPAASLFGAAQLQAQQEAYPEERRDTYTVKPHKHDFPRFDGSASYLWIDLGESYFKLYCVPSHRWINVPQQRAGYHLVRQKVTRIEQLQKCHKFLRLGEADAGGSNGRHGTCIANFADMDQNQHVILRFDKPLEMILPH